MSFFTEPPGRSEPSPPLSNSCPSLGEPLSGWLLRRFGAPTEIQRLAWPAIASGSHVLVSAPTGTGKLLAVFAPILQAFLTPGQPIHAPVRSGIACLYISPLKALGRDAAEHIATYLEELARTTPGDPPRLALRTGDSSPRERRRLAAEPPDILFTTPESLAVLLSQAAFTSFFAGLRWIVVDEVHALAGSKRGADLSLSLERLTRLAGEAVQRIGMSATASPHALAASWLSGVERTCTLVEGSPQAPMQLTLLPLDPGARYLAALVDCLLPELHSSHTTLVFTNTRKLAEQLAWALRRNLPAWHDQVGVHHSSLSAARRLEVEDDLKSGRLRVVVTSTSLELGIDIGPIDLAVLVHPPGDVVRLLQRVGRAGHGPHRFRRGLILTRSPAQLLEAAVTAASSTGPLPQCEPLEMPSSPLDVLCQQILGLAAAGPVEREWLFTLARRATPFQNLARQDFEACIAFLCGRDHQGLPWLPPRLEEHEGSLVLRGRQTAQLIRCNLGTILTEPEWDVTVASLDSSQEQRPLGQIDQTYAERLHPGDRFVLDGRCLEVLRLDEGSMAVQTRETIGLPRVPQWAGSAWPLSRHLAWRLYSFRAQAAEALRDGPEALNRVLHQDFHLDGPALAILADHFQHQEAISEIPDTRCLLVEGVHQDWGDELYLHTPLNRLGNDALARVLVHRLARDWGRSASTEAADLGLCLQARGALEDAPTLLRALLDPAAFDTDLDEALEESLAYRSRFGQVAQISLMLVGRPYGRRRRVGGAEWGERRLFEQVRAHDPHFVLLQQALREVRTEICDALAARELLEQQVSRPLRCRWLAGPSPFALGWTQVGAAAVESVQTPGEVLAQLHATLLGQGGMNAGAR